MAKKISKKEAIKSKAKRGQVTLWIIIALAIVVGFLILFTFRRAPSVSVEAESNPAAFIDKCARKAINDAVDQIIPHGGFIEPVNYIEYNRINVSYLCENRNYYLPCINAHPMLITEITNEIHNLTQPILDQCFSNLKTELEKRQNKVVYDPMKFIIELAPNKVFVNIDRKVTVTRAEEARKFEKFNIQVVNPIYDLANVAIEIANNEANYCYFEYVGYMLLYPRWKIDVFSFSEGTRIYTITDKDSEKQMNVAIRSCVIPAGLGF